MSAVILNGQAVRVNNIFCIGRNYAAHIAELGNAVPQEPLIFFKPNSSLLTQDRISLPPFSRNIHYETEIVLLMGDVSGSLNPQNAWDSVAGIGIGLDLTARDIQAAAKAQGLPWARAKGFKHAACVSQFTAPSALPDRDHICFSLHHNGRHAQQGDSRLMLYPVPQLLHTLHQDYGLQNGDLVFTGTPEGVGALQSGDILELDLQEGLLNCRFEVA